MGLRFTEGTYDKLGVNFDYPKETDIGKNVVTFTFQGEKEDKCVLVLIRKKDQVVTRIEVPEQYCLGSMRSITVEHIKASDYNYYYEINGKKVLDPYARAIFGRNRWMDESRKDCVYEILDGFDSDEFDWGQDCNPEIPKGEMIIYKLHVRGFSMDAGRQKINGTFEAIKRRIDYFKGMNITTLELMPVYEFEETDIPKVPEVPGYIKWETEKEDVIVPGVPSDAGSKVHYWGYVKGDYFAVKASYAMNPDRAATEYKELVKSLHENGIEIIMEMFFPEDVNPNMVMDILRFWVRIYHVDGFHLLGRNLPIDAIAQDMVLSRTKIFYTGYSEHVLGNKKYPNLYVYKEEYQFPARKLLNHMNPDMSEFIDQQKKQGERLGYVNYLASNNGFTLADLFMYNDKHNEANGEDNQDGEAWNLSNNYGVEGPSRKKMVVAARRLRWFNAMAMLFLAQGVPLLWEGDEIANSQQGNNNAYCQDNPVGWVNWKNEKKCREELDFLRKLTCFRKEHPIISNPVPYRFHDYKSVGFPDVSFHGDSAWLLQVDRNRMNLGVFYYGEYAPGTNKDSVYVAYNFYSAESTLALPKLHKKYWYLLMDTSREERFLKQEQKVDENTIILKPLSICILVGK